MLTVAQIEAIQELLSEIPDATIIFNGNAFTTCPTCNGDGVGNSYPLPCDCCTSWDECEACDGLGILVNGEKDDGGL